MQNTKFIMSGKMMQSNLLVPGLGTPISQLALGTAFYRYEEKQRWFELLDEFVSLGGTLLDSGRHYGTSEQVIGQWMASRGIREQVVLITKCGHGNCELPAENFEQMVTDEFEKSLELLQTDYIDLYMLHRDNPSVPVARIIDRLNREIDNGRIRTLGASNWTCSRVDEANEYARRHGLTGFATVSNNLSLAVQAQPFYKGLVDVDQSAERWFQATGIPLIVWSSQARGFFTGRYAPEMQNRMDSLESDFDKRMVEVYCTEENFERLRRARELGTSKGGYSAMQVALAWLLHKPFKLIPIVGPHTREELLSCFQSLSLKLSDAEVQWLNLTNVLPVENECMVN
jgi:1-deoxyxylulose-5-phosphate synthase